MIPAELILTGNGPGELSGWVLPVARSARTLATWTGTDLRLTLALSPSQFAGGREPEVVQRWGLFDRIMDPKHCTRLALGLEHFPVAPRTAIVHLGGDLWFSARLARRLGVPVGALAETVLIARRHRPFALVFAVSEALAKRLVVQGVPREKIVVTGDPRVDAVTEAHDQMADTPHSPPSSFDGHSLVSFLPGSRDDFFRFLIPYFLSAADVLVSTHPETTFQIIVSPFLSPHLVAQTHEEVARRWPHLRVGWVTDQMWAALGKSALVLTIPGTNTLELAMAGIPFAVVMPTDRIERIPAEGALEWVGRIPGVGRLLKRAALSRYLSRHRFVALPNLKAGRPLVPEWIGRWTPQDLAKRLSDLLLDEGGRAAMAAALRQVYDATPGASRAIVNHAMALAGDPQEKRL